MLFLISFLFAAAFSVLCGKAIRKHPAPFYLAATVLSTGTAILANTRFPEMPAFVQQDIVPLFTKGILAAAFWAAWQYSPRQHFRKSSRRPFRGKMRKYPKNPRRRISQLP